MGRFKDLENRVSKLWDDIIELKEHGPRYDHYERRVSGLITYAPHRRSIKYDDLMSMLIEHLDVEFVDTAPSRSTSMRKKTKKGGTG